MAGKAKGDIGEAIAKVYLINHGYQILECNYYSRFGEIDVIAQKATYIVFVEVKYRGVNRYGTPGEAVNFKKREKIRKTALHYISKHNITDSDFRFDIIEITGGRGAAVNHLKNAF